MIDKIIKRFRDPGFSGLIMFIVGVMGIVVAIVPWHLNERGSKGTPAPSPEDLNKIIAPIIAPIIARSKDRGEEVGSLREQLAAAIKRASKAEQMGIADAKGIVEELLESGDTARLMEFLAARDGAIGEIQDGAKKEQIALKRELAAVAYLRGEINTAESALDGILEVLPYDLDALNRKGRICYLRDDLGEAKEVYEKVLELAEDSDDKGAQAAAHGNLGGVYHKDGETDDARESWTEARELYQKIGMPHMVKRVQGWLDKLPKSD